MNQPIVPAQPAVTRSRLCAGALALLGAVGSAHGEAAHEEPLPVATAAVVPAAFLRSANYDLAPEAVIADNFYQFEVGSDFGNYAVTSRAMLRVRLHEITTIAELWPRLDDTDGTLDRSPGGRRGVGSERVVDILADPVGTASQLLGNIQYNVESTFDPPGTAAAGAATTRGAVDLNPGPHKRSAAAQLGVDVYSSNAELQGVLERLARARSGGETVQGFSPLLRNIYAYPKFGSGVLDTRLESTLKNTSAEELNATLLATLEDLKVPRRVRVAFVTHPAYTPRTRLYFTTFVELLGPVSHVGRLFAAASSATTEADALAYVNYARMLAYYQVSGGDLARVVTAARFPTLATHANDAVLALPVDYLAWTASVAAAADALHEIRERENLTEFRLLLAGGASPRAVRELTRRRVEVRNDFSF